MDDERREPRAGNERERARIVRRATLYAAMFFGAAILAAVGGSALIAWLLSNVGLPFRETWAAIAVVVLVVPVAVAGIGRLRRGGD